MTSEINYELHDPVLHQVVLHIATICFSGEFLLLRNELQRIYEGNKVSNADITAFSDALYAILSQELNEAVLHKLRAN